MTATLRPLWGIAFAALLALSLVAGAADALAGTPSRNSGGALFDQGFYDFDFDFDLSSPFLHPRPIGHLGVTWE